MKNKIEGHPNLIKDMETGVISNRENSDRSRYRMAKNQAYANKNSEVELKELRNEIDELKGLIHELLNK